jgi:hypothetical protein
MMTLDYVGDGEAMEYAQLGQQPLARTTETVRGETSPELNPGTLSCLSARPPDLADVAGTRPRPRVVLHVPEHCPVCMLHAHGGDAIPGFALWTIDFRSCDLSPLRLLLSWTYPTDT